jgi:hypothetical protein
MVLCAAKQENKTKIIKEKKILTIKVALVNQIEKRKKLMKKLQKAKMLMLFYLKRHSKIEYIMAQKSLAKKIYCKKTIIIHTRVRISMDNQKILNNIHVELMIVH